MNDERKQLAEQIGCPVAWRQMQCVNNNRTVCHRSPGTAP